MHAHAHTHIHTHTHTHTHAYTHIHPPNPPPTHRDAQTHTLLLLTSFHPPFCQRVQGSLEALETSRRLLTGRNHGIGLVPLLSRLAYI